MTMILTMELLTICISNSNYTKKDFNVKQSTAPLYN